MAPSHKPAIERTPGTAVASLIFGIISVLGGILLLLPPILAIVFGHVTRAKCKREGTKAGDGMGLAGLIMGYLSLATIPIIGLLAAMAIPAFHKVRTASQDKVMLNNARQLAAAADQYYLENDVKAARWEDLVGETRYIKTIQAIDNETYPTDFRMDQPIVILKKNGKEVRYP